MPDVVRAGALWGYSQLIQSMGHDAGGLLARVELAPQDLDNPDAYISRPAIVALLELSAAELECPDFGMRLAELQDVNILGALAFAVRNAPDLRQSITAMARHIHFQSRHASLSIEPLRGGNEERIVFNAPHLERCRQITERAASLFCRIINHLTADRAYLTRVMFMHEPLLPSSAYGKYLEGVVPQFSATENCVCLDHDVLAMPLETVNPRLQMLVESYLESCAPKPSVPIESRTYEALAQIMRHGPASMEDVADMLHMHPRTLQRRLADAGATFERLRDEIRKDMAERHLSNPLVPLSEVAAVLGYSNQSALTRSCARWFGRSPKNMRRQLNHSRAAE